MTVTYQLKIRRVPSGKWSVYLICVENGKTILASRPYHDKAEAVLTANKLAHATGLKYGVETDDKKK